MNNENYAPDDRLSLSFLGSFSFYRNIFLASVFINLFVLAIPLFTMSVYDRVLPDFDEPTLIVLSIGVFIALFFDFLLKMVRSLYLNSVSSIVAQNQESCLMERVLSAGHSPKISVGDNLSFFRELSNIRAFWSSRLLPFFFDAPFFLVFIIIIYTLSPVLAFVPVVGALVIIAVGVACAFLSGSVSEQKIKLMQNKSNFLLDTLSGAGIIYGLNASKDKMDAWSDLLSQEQTVQRSDVFFQAFLSNFAVFVNLAVSVFVLFLGAYEVSGQNLTIGGMIAISILSSRCLAPIISLSPLFIGFRQYMSSRAHAKAFLAEDAQSGASALSTKSDVDGSLSVSGLSFRYPAQGRDALQDVTLDIRAHGKYGFIGPSGAGKTTLAKVMAGMLVPDSGAVKWGDYSLDAISPAQRADIVSVSSQEDHFFKGTIADNVFMGLNSGQDRTSEFVERAVHTSGLDMVLKQSGFGWDTPVEYRGAGLSAGQRQSMSLARALISDPKILIFDEPLAGMDHALELRLKQHLPAYIEGRTFIMITHRTSLLPLVDHLVLLENGAVKLSGPRDEILKGLS
jgi:ATP-binding cassette subfamily C protein LapB